MLICFFSYCVCNQILFYAAPVVPSSHYMFNTYLDVCSCTIKSSRPVAKLLKSIIRIPLQKGKKKYKIQLLYAIEALIARSDNVSSNMSKHAQQLEQGNDPHNSMYVPRINSHVAGRNVHGMSGQ